MHYSIACFILVIYIGRATCSADLHCTSRQANHRSWQEGCSHPHYLMLKFVQPLLTGFPLVSPFPLTTRASLFNPLFKYDTFCLLNPAVTLLLYTSPSFFWVMPHLELDVISFERCKLLLSLKHPVCFFWKETHVAFLETERYLQTFQMRLTEAYLYANWGYRWHRTFHLALQYAVTLTIQTRSLLSQHPNRSKALALLLLQSPAFWSGPVMVPWCWESSLSSTLCSVRQSSARDTQWGHSPSNLLTLLSLLDKGKE